MLLGLYDIYGSKYGKCLLVNSDWDNICIFVIKVIK